MITCRKFAFCWAAESARQISCQPRVFVVVAAGSGPDPRHRGLRAAEGPPAGAVGPLVQDGLGRPVWPPMSRGFTFWGHLVPLRLRGL